MFKIFYCFLDNLRLLSLDNLHVCISVYVH